MNRRIEDVASLALERSKAYANCPRHLFDMKGVIGEDLVTHGRKVSCMRCGGHPLLVSALAYIKGYEAAGLPVEDVAAGYDAIQFQSPTCTCPQCDGKNRMPYPGAWQRGSDCPLCLSAGVVLREQATAFLMKSSKKVLTAKAETVE